MKNKNIFLMILFFILIFILPLSVCYEDKHIFTESFDYIFYTNSTNSSNNILTMSPSKYAFFDNRFIIIIATGSFNIYNSSFLYSGKSFATIPINNPTYAGVMLKGLFNFSDGLDCEINKCYVSSETRISFNATLENYEIGGGSIFPLHSSLGFITKNYPFINYSTHLNSRDILTRCIGSSCSNTVSVCQVYNTTFNKGGFFNFTLGQLNTYCNISYTTEIVGFVFVFWHEYDSSYSNPQKIDNLIIDGIFNGTNELPEMNISISNPLKCIINETDTTQFNISYRGSDYENNTIYYSYSSLENYLSERVISFFHSSGISGYLCYNIDIFCNLQRDYKFLSKTYFNENTCSINKNGYFLNNTYALTNVYDMEKNPTTVLWLSKSCIMPDRSFYYRIDETLEDFAYNVHFYDLTNGESFNISFKNSFFEDIMKYNIQVSGNRFLLYNINGSDNLLIANISDSKLNSSNGISSIFSFILNSQRSLNNTISLFFNAEDSFLVYRNSFPNKNIDFLKYISVTPDINTNIGIGSFRYSGIEVLPNFTTTRVDTVNFKGIGLFMQQILISDSVNIPDRYNIYTLYGQVDKCENKITGTSIPDEIQEQLNNIKPDSFINELNELIYGLRSFFFKIPYDLGVLNLVLLAYKVGIIIFMVSYYKKETEKGRTTDEVFKSMFILLFVFVSLGYLIFIIEKSYFVIFSVIGLLYLSSQIHNLTGMQGSVDEKAFIKTMATFGVFLYIWFGLFQVVSGVSFGLGESNYIAIDYDNISLIGENSIFNIGMNLLKTLGSVLFFTIPNIPLFLNFILQALKIFTLISMVIVIRNFFIPTSQA